MFRLVNSKIEQLIKRRKTPPRVRSQSRPRAARAMTSATASGRDNMMTWLERTVVVSALIGCAIVASRAGESTRSSLATMYHEGFVSQAGAVAGVPRATAAIGP